jgi:hypothetical protein
LIRRADATCIAIYNDGFGDGFARDFNAFAGLSASFRTPKSVFRCEMLSENSDLPGKVAGSNPAPAMAVKQRSAELTPSSWLGGFDFFCHRRPVYLGLQT